MRKTFLMMLIATITFAKVIGQTIPLYPGEIPGGKTVPDEEKVEQRYGRTIISKISRPTLSVFLPDSSVANGTAVVICPGGGYWVNAMEHEGNQVAKAFNDIGVAAFVLKYRIPDDASMEDRANGALQDAQQAMKLVREGAASYGIDPGRVGIMGFSAGGHLASTAGTHFDRKLINTTLSLRPDFMILIYPVISFTDSLTHRGSREQLIGKSPSREKIRMFSSELQVTPSTPPTFLVHASDDDAVKVGNSLAFYANLIRNKVAAELHVYQKGGHGFGLDNPTTSDRWFERCRNWMASNGWLKGR